MATARHGADESVVGPSTRIVGRVSGRGGLRVEGSIEGDVSIGGTAEIGPGASIEGDLSAESIEIGGRLIGDASARGGIAVRAGAEVRGDLRGAGISIEPGSKVDVRLDTELELESEAGRERR